MKKKLITLMTITAIIASSGAVFADAVPTPTAAPTDDLYVMPVTVDETEIQAPVVIPSYISNTVTVTEISEGKIATKTNDVKETESELENVINYITNENTLVYTSKGEKKALADVKKDSVITVFTGSYTPAPLIMPPQYEANVIIINDEEEVGSVNVDTYLKDGEKLINAANSLELNIGETTEIVDTEENKVEADELANKDLIVFYTITTRSIPAQTPPEKVVVLGENEVALKNINAANEPEETQAPETTAAPEVTADPEATAAPEVTAEPEATQAPVDYSKVINVKVKEESLDYVYIKEDGTLMLPLRKITETLGMTVDWDGETRTVILNGGMFSLKIGENSYAKGKMMPVELNSAPEIVNDLTYVPVEYFTEILEIEAVLDNDTLRLY